MGEDTANEPQDARFDRSYYNNRVWGNQAAQNTWMAMWPFTTERNYNNPVVAGDELMCEPSSNEVSSFPTGAAIHEAG